MGPLTATLSVDGRAVRKAIGAASITMVKSRLAVAGLKSRAIWLGDDFRLRCGRSGDVVTMLDDLGKPAVL